MPYKVIKTDYIVTLLFKDGALRLFGIDTSATIRISAVFSGRYQRLLALISSSSKNTETKKGQQLKLGSQLTVTMITHY